MNMVFDKCSPLFLFQRCSFCCCCGHCWCWHGCGEACTWFTVSCGCWFSSASVTFSWWVADEVGRWWFWLFLLILQIHCPIRISPMGNSGCFPWGKPAATVKLLNLYCMLVFFCVCFQNLLNSYMNVRILICICYLFACVDTWGEGGPWFVVSSKRFL